MVKDLIYISYGFFLEKIIQIIHFLNIKEYIINIYTDYIDIYTVLLFCIICINRIRKTSISIENANSSMYYPLYTR
jgi:hypothetical protein